MRICASRAGLLRVCCGVENLQCPQEGEQKIKGCWWGLLSESLFQTGRHKHVITARGERCHIRVRVLLSALMLFLLSEEPPASNNPQKNLIPTVTGRFSWRCYPLYRARQFHSRLHQCLPSSWLIGSVSSAYQWDRGQISTPTFYLPRTSAR